MTAGLFESIASVVNNDNCTGCGACSLLTSQVQMVEKDGFMRPRLPRVALVGTMEDEAAAVRTFEDVCPGLGLRAPPSEPNYHPIFGGYVSVWESWALDEEIRFAGSSGGVLTALSTWLVSSGRVPKVVGSGPSATHPTRTVPVSIQTRADAMKAAGSRYAPVANLTGYSPDASKNALVGKPCEVSAAYQLNSALGRAETERPILLSFFCAGTPSQNATDGLIRSLGSNPEDVVSLRYRGNGWPGNFQIETSAGVVLTSSYDDSWGKHLGRDLQWRCKTCVDGTGGHADVAVGDYWSADSDGYPVFENAAGKSVVIARTRRGHQLLLEASREGIVSLFPIDIDAVARVQPLQSQRKITMLGRLAGRVLAGKRIPHYRGYGLARVALMDIPRTAKAAMGTFARTLSFDRKARANRGGSSV